MAGCVRIAKIEGKDENGLNDVVFRSLTIDSKLLTIFPVIILATLNSNKGLISMSAAAKISSCNKTCSFAKGVVKYGTKTAKSVGWSTFFICG